MKVAYTRFELRMEFLIKRKDGDWFDLHRDQFDETLRPSSYLSKRVSLMAVKFSFRTKSRASLSRLNARTSPRTRRR